MRASEWYPLLVVLVSALPGCAESGDAPEALTSRSPDSGACPELTAEVRFTGPSVGHTWIVSTTGRSTYIRPLFARHQIGVFDQEGRQERVIGSEGEGPGEFRHIKAVVPREGGSLLVMDIGNNRLTTLDVDGSLVETLPVRILVEDNGLSLLPDSTFLVSGRLPTPEFYGYPFFRLDRSGEVLAAFSGPVETPRGQVYEPVVTEVLRAGAIWSTPKNRLALAEWTLGGDSLRTIADPRPWLEQEPVPPRSEGPRQNEADLRLPPQSQIVDLMGLEGQRLLVVGLTADENWDEAGRPRATGRWPDFYDSIVEVWDLGEESLLCSQRYDQYLFRAVGGFLFGYSQDRRGSPIIHRWEIQ